MLKFVNPTLFRQLIVCSILSERPISIESPTSFYYRIGEDNPGMAEYEVTFLKLVEKITNGTKIQIDETGSSIKFYPGIITNNDDANFEFDCGIIRSIGYYLEPLAMIALFGKSNLQCVLKGITNDELDQSVDYFAQCSIKLIKEFGVEGEISLKVFKRGFRPLGGGEVKFKCTTCKLLKSIQLIEEGFVKRIRGWAYASKVSPQILNRIISSARGVLNDYIPDVWVYSDHYKGPKAGLSSGYGITLISESTTNCQLGVDEILETDKIQEDTLPEVIGEKVALRLLDELYYSGYVDSTSQSLVFLLMALAEKKISFIKVGRISSYIIQFLRNLRTFFGIKFQIKNSESPVFKDFTQSEQETEGKIADIEKSLDENNMIIPEETVDELPQNLIFSCMGIGLSNFSRKLL